MLSSQPWSNPKCLASILWILLLLLGVQRVSAHPKNDTATNSEYSTPKSFRVVTEHLPPYQIAHENRLIGGANYQFVKTVLARANLQVKIELMPWARAYKTSLSQKNVFIFSMVRSQEREQHFRWLAKLNNVDYAIYINAQRADIQVSSLQDTLGYTAVSVRGTYEASVLQILGFEPDRNLVLVNNMNDSWAMLLADRVDFTVSSNEEGMILPRNQIRVVPDAQFSAHMYLATHLETDQELIDRFTRAYQEVVSEGDYDPLIQPQLVFK